MTPIRAALTGSDRCEAEGFVAIANAPTFSLCRKLMVAGFDPARPLHAYRGDTLALTVSSIGWGAGRVLWETPQKGFRIAPWKPAPGAWGRSPIESKEPPADEPRL